MLLHWVYGDVFLSEKQGIKEGDMLSFSAGFSFEKAIDKGRVCQLYFTAIKTCKILQILFINLSHVFHTDNDVALTATFRRKSLV